MTKTIPPRARVPAAFSRKQALAGTTNERQILDLIRRHGTITRAELARLTQLTVQSVSRIVDALAARELLLFGEREQARGLGNTGAAVRLNDGAAYSLGASVMTDSVSVALMDFGGRVLEIQSRPFGTSGSSDPVALIGELTDDLAARHLPARPPLVGAGLAITGYFVGDDRVNPPEPLGEFALVDLRRMFEQRLGLDVIVENDGTAAAVAESFLGVGLRYRSFAYLQFAHGVGGGVVVDGRAMRGARGNAGEVAGVLPEALFEDRPTLASLLTMLIERGVALESISDMVERFDPHWPGVEEWVARVEVPLNHILSALSSVVDPEAIVFGGRIPPALADLLIERASFFSVPRRAMPRPQAALVRAEVGGDPAVIGAAALPLKEHLFL